MKSYASLSIRNKLMIIIIGVSMSIVLLVGGLRLYWDNIQARDELVYKLSAISSLIADRSSAALAFDDANLAEDNLSSLRVVQHITSACLFRADGKLLAAYVRNAGSKLNSCEHNADEIEDAEFFTDNLYVIRSAIELGPNRVGFIVLESDLSLITDRRDSQLIFTLIAFLIAIIASIGLAIVLQRHISDPILEMTKVAEVIEEKADYSLRALETGDDEVGQLSRTFNNMLDTLAHRNDELVKAQDEQFAASKLYRSLISSTSAIPWELDLSTWLFSYVGQQAEAVFGYPVNEWYEKGFWASNLHPDDREKSMTYCQESSAQNLDHQFEYRMRKADGEYIWIHDDVQVISENGTPVRLQGFMFDITERKRHEEAIQNIAAGVSAQVGDQFFQQLVIQLASLFGARFAFIGLVDESMTSVTTHTLAAGGKIIDNISYQLENTPCANVLKDSTCSFPENVQEMFPEDHLLIEMGVQSYIGTPMFDVEGKVIGLVVVMDTSPMKSTEQVTEILEIFTARASAEIQRTLSDQKLHEAQKKLEMHVKQTPLGVIQWDVNFKVSNWNPGAEKIFGYRADEVIGKPASELILKPEQLANIEEAWNALISNRGGRYSRNENLTKDGHVIMCEWYNTTLVTESGEVIGVASFVSDITTEHQALTALQRKETEQRNMLNTMVDAVITVDNLGAILSVNKAAEIMFGLSPEKNMDDNINLLLPGISSNGIENYLPKNNMNESANTVGRTYELVAKRIDGDNFPVRVSMAELGNIKGNRKFILSCHDVTEEKQKEEQLHRSQKMDALGKLTGGIAHDYNNMLGVVLGYAELLEAKLHDQPKLAEYVKEIHRAGDRGAKLSQKLLAFSKRKISDADVVDINSILLEEKNMLEKTLTARFRLEFDLYDELWPVWLDVNDLEDAILNMSINAMHAMDDHGQLTIQTMNVTLSSVEAQYLNLDDGDYVMLGITDTGCGMDSLTMEKVFEPFFSTKGEMGTGLGLSQVYGFVQRNGGSIKIYSEPGHGTRINLYFPRYFVDQDTKTIEQSRDEDRLQGEGTVLVVDDEPQLLQLTEEILSTNGYRVLTSDGASDALKILENETVDLLLTDVIMPDIDGYELVAIVHEKYPAIKIQMASGYSEHKHADLIDNYYHENLMQKPYHAKKLLRRLKDLLST